MGRCTGFALLTLAVVAGACRSDEGQRAATAPVIPTSETPPRKTTAALASGGAPVETQRPTAPPTSPATAPATSPATESTSRASTTDASTAGPGRSRPLDARELVEALAADELEGRDNGTAGSLAAQQILIGQLAHFAQPADPTMVGDDGFRHVFSSGTNLLGVIPGGDLADEWVVLGAHYDHLGTDCRIDDPADSICNGATDNATGVAVALGAARAIAAAGTPRRSVLVALWDAEEDGLIGSAAYLQAPHTPATQRSHTSTSTTRDRTCCRRPPTGP